MRIRFSETRVVADQFTGTDRETRFEAGQVYDLPATSAARWVHRGAATFVDDAPAGPEQADGAVPAPAEKQVRGPGVKPRQGFDRPRVMT